MVVEFLALIFDGRMAPFGAVERAGGVSFALQQVESGFVLL